MNQDFCFWDWNIQNGEIRMSSHWMNNLGLDAYDLPTDSKWFNSLVHPEDLPMILTEIEKHLSGEDENCEFYYRLRNQRGNYLSFKSKSMIVFCDEAGIPVKLLWTSQK